MLDYSELSDVPLAFSTISIFSWQVKHIEIIKKNAGKCQIIRTNLVYLEMIYIYIHIITYTVIRQCSKKKFKIKKMKKRVYLPLKSPVTINRAPFLSCIEYMYNYCTPDRPSHTPIYDLYRYAMKTSLVSKMGRW